MSLAFDPAEIPAYAAAQVARCLAIPIATLEYWLLPRSGPLVMAPATRPFTLSFKNLVECHVLRTLREENGLKMRRIRSGVATLRQKWNTRYPLADKDLSTDNIGLFLEEGARTYDLTHHGAQAFSEILRPYLRRIDRDETGVARRFYPVLKIGPTIESEPRIVVIDPAICFGRPVIAGTRITTEVVAGRYASGERIAKLARQYERKEEEIRAAIKFEARRRA